MCFWFQNYVKCRMTFQAVLVRKVLYYEISLKLFGVTYFMKKNPQKLENLTPKNVIINNLLKRIFQPLEVLYKRNGYF